MATQDNIKTQKDKLNKEIKVISETKEAKKNLMGELHQRENKKQVNKEVQERKALKDQKQLLLQELKSEKIQNELEKFKHTPLLELQQMMETDLDKAQQEKKKFLNQEFSKIRTQKAKNKQMLQELVSKAQHKEMIKQLKQEITDIQQSKEQKIILLNELKNQYEAGKFPKPQSLAELENLKKILYEKDQQLKKEQMIKEIKKNQSFKDKKQRVMKELVDRDIQKKKKNSLNLEIKQRQELKEKKLDMLNELKSENVQTRIRSKTGTALMQLQNLKIQQYDAQQQDKKKSVMADIWKKGNEKRRRELLFKELEAKVWHKQQTNKVLQEMMTINQMKINKQKVLQQIQTEEVQTRIKSKSITAISKLQQLKQSEYDTNQQQNKALLNKELWQKGKEKERRKILLNDIQGHFQHKELMRTVQKELLQLQQAKENKIQVLEQLQKEYTRLRSNSGTAISKLNDLKQKEYEQEQRQKKDMVVKQIQEKTRKEKLLIQEKLVNEGLQIHQQKFNQVSEELKIKAAQKLRSDSDQLDMSSKKRMTIQNQQDVDNAGYKK